MLNTPLQADLLQRKQRHLYRSRRLQGSCALDFSRNDYLSLADDPRLKKAYQEGFERYPVGSGGSMVVSGYHPTHQALEQAFSEALGVEDAILFSSGYAANLSVMSLLGVFKTSVLMDKNAHASFYDGLRLGGVSYRRYRSNRPSDFAFQRKKMPDNTVVVTESIFSMSGYCAPLQAISAAGLPLIVDEAHAFGVIGPNGLGGVMAAGLTETEVPLRIIPLGKACVATGAMVVGQRDWIEALIQVARPYIYSTAISPGVAYGMKEALSLLMQAEDNRLTLRALIAYFREKITQSSYTWGASSTPIQQLKLGCPARAIALSEQLAQQGIVCVSMRQPTVSRVDTGLRIILNANHLFSDIDRLFACLDASW